MVLHSKVLAICEIKKSAVDEGCTSHNPWILLVRKSFEHEVFELLRGLESLPNQLILSPLDRHHRIFNRVQDRFLILIAVSQLLDKRCQKLMHILRHLPSFYNKKQ